MPRTVCFNSIQKQEDQWLLVIKFPLFDAREASQNYRVQNSIEPTMSNLLIAATGFEFDFQKIHFTDLLFHVKERGKADQFFAQASWPVACYAFCNSDKVHT